MTDYRFGPVLLFLFGWITPLVLADWTFTPVPKGECGPLAVTWAGGKAPYTATVHPINGTGQLINIPDSAYQNGQGSYEITLQVPQGGRYVVTMGDANGPLTGGASELLTAGPRQDGTAACNTTYATPDFVWSANANDNIFQCQTYPFTDIGTALGAKIVQPVTLLVIIPGGNQSFSIKLPNSPSYAWITNVAKGTNIVFDMFDSQNNQGGVEQVRTVKAGDSSCQLHNAKDGSSTPGGPNATNTPAPSKSTDLSKGAIIGIAAGAAVVLSIVALLIFLLLRGRRRRGNYEKANIDLLGGPHSPTHHSYTVDNDQVLPPGAMPQPYYDNPPSSLGAASRSRTSKSALLSQNERPTTFIQHSDIAEASGPVELPPQYSDSRQPLLGANGQWVGGSGSSSHTSPGGSGFTSSTAGSSSMQSGSVGSSNGRSNSMRKGPR
ncbi:hypothetical protein DL96DRAFT_601365 [Flagelloscypha sp. PMI_526]|nr:hypothetical protein DL96DRAFT_601365 [Flagelloscypha sp. PMI_526]